MSWHLLRRLGWDTETTGVIPTEARIVTVAVVVRGGGHPDRVFSHLINPGVPIPEETTAVHGIDDARAQADGLDPRDALEDIADKLTAALRAGMPVVAFNTSYDWTVLNCDLARNGLPTMADRLRGADPVTLVDPHVLDRQARPFVRGAGQRKLGPTCARYGVELEDWHTAEADALAALLLADAQFAKFPQFQRAEPSELFAAQQRWRAEQQAGLQEWFRTKATAEQGGDPGKVIDGSWPLIPAPRDGGGS
ncbi:DNA polymerase III subunit epsilon [Streptomyces sp. N2-109]|uniref:DNA polymerase III subunit epsilon n=1 Tax=Streptomyces gossypii TaxID=2883101 RepID=A0ABT2JUD8_9ACTN|nr:exonuclease domain-containing protein [Streptomyces gossypii]MCT2591094.1 DNA polymerase III subunit epsilon [Streptomyces gossypii]